jgi:hypothetical protein
MALNKSGIKEKILIVIRETNEGCWEEGNSSDEKIAPSSTKESDCE